MNDFQNLYEVKKTVRFELKAISEKDEFAFENSNEFMKENFLKYGVQAKTKEERNEKIRENLKTAFDFSETIYSDFSDFLKKLEKKTIPLGGIEITAQLLEHLDSQEFHNHKKGSNKTKFIPLHHLKGDIGYSWFFGGIKKKIQEIRKFEVLIKNHQLWIQSDFMAMESAVRWYADTESFAKKMEEFLTLLSFMRLPEIDVQENENWTEEERNTWNNATKNLKNIFDEEKKEQQKTNAKNLQEAIKENAFVECGMLSMNERGLNKNPQKIEKMKKWLEEIQKEQEIKLGQIRALDEKRKLLLDGDKTKNTKGLYKLLDEESEKWVQNGTDKCPEFAFYLLKTQKYNQHLHEKKKELAELRNKKFEETTEEGKKEFGKLRNEINRLKVEKGLIQDRKRIFLEDGILSFKIDEKKFLDCKTVEEILEKKGKLNKEISDLKKSKNWKEVNQKEKLLSKLSNFQYVWEKKFKTPKNGNEIYFLQISDSRFDKKDLFVSSELQTLHQQNLKLIREKRKLSQDYGNNKNIINSLQREIERQGKIEYQGVLLKDENFYYLAFLEREKRNDLWKKHFAETQNSEFEALQYERLTFKALEKLALIENATFKEFDELKDVELARQLRETYQSTYKEKQFLEYKLTREENQYIWEKKINKFDFAKKRQNELKNDVIQILTKVIAKLGYSFSPKSSYETLDDFASDINLQCYQQKWMKIDKAKLFEAEKNGKIQIFKIHNKDFSKAKREHQRSDNPEHHRKNNLFTEYWLDLFEKENAHIRILPEIDLYKKRKEKEIDEIGKIVTKRKKIELDAQGNRFCEDKFYAGFKLVFYPEKNSPTVEEFNEQMKTRESKCFLGLDRGENELLTYCLIDENGKVMKNIKTGTKLLGDWNLDENDFDYSKKLKGFAKKRNELLEQSILLQDSDNEEKKEKIYSQLEENSDEFKTIEKEIKELEDKKNKESILEADTVKRGICGHILEQINEIMMQYPNTYIVLEDLDISQNDEEQGNTNKENNLEKTLGVTAYQVVEDAIISKFKYYQTKNNQFEGMQFVPNIERVRDLREVKDNAKLERNKFGRIKFVRSKEQIGRVLFVDELYSSQVCPECGFFIASKTEKERAEKLGKPIYFEDMQEKGFSVCENGENSILEFGGKKYELNHWKYCKEATKTKFLKKEQNICENILKPRLKAQKDLLIDEGKKDDKFFCPCCGKNTEEKNFTEGFASGDDVAAYNIAKRGLSLLKSK